MFYAWLISLSLILHVFNDLEIGKLKLFQIPAAFAFIVSPFLGNKTTRIQVYSYLFILFTFISAILSPYPDSLLNALTFTIILGACIAIPKCSFYKLIKITNFLIPIPLFFLLIELTKNLNYRYIGFYNDPNYLCTTILVFLFIILADINRTKNIIIKVFYIIEIIGIIIIAIATLSRTGLLCIALLVIINSWGTIKKHKIGAIILLIIAIIYFSNNTPQTVSDIIEQIESRESNPGNFSSASKLRYEISMGGVNYVISHPYRIPFGMGIGAVGHWEFFENYVNDNHIDHNTLTTCFSGQGLICLILYFLILYTTFKTNRRLPRGKLKVLRISAFMVIFIFSLSINQMTYLPFWWLIFLLNNTTNDNYENTTYS